MMDKLDLVTLHDGNMTVELLNYGAVTRSWTYKGKNMILGYSKISDYLSDPFYLGAIVGRVANRISDAHFTIGDQVLRLPANEGPSVLHGGAAGIASVFWDIKKLSNTKARLTHLSPDGASGFPGEVAFQIDVILEEPQLRYEITATPSRSTPISIAQHNYYTLGHSSSILDHDLWVGADQRLETDANKCSSGAMISLKDDPLNFKTAKSIESAGCEIDDFFVFSADSVHAAPVAIVEAANGLKLNVYSDQKGAQIYDGSGLKHPFEENAGLCIEPSGFPNAVNCPNFPSQLHSPDKPYHQNLMVEVICTK